MIYNLLLFFYALGMAPLIIWQIWRQDKCMPSLKDRLGLPTPTKAEGEGRRIWIHAVSLGEMKAATPLIKRYYENKPRPSILVTTSTATGYDEAHRSLPPSTIIRYFPLDFSWTMRRWIKSFRPHLIIFVEGDIWPNLKKEASLAHVKTALVSGRISERSARRFRLFRQLSQRLFGSLDLLCAQNEENRDRFATIVNREISITGNLKLDVDPLPIDSSSIHSRFSISQKQPVVTIACTHAPEERELIEALQPLWKNIPDLVVFLAPRHPERFSEVAHLLSQMKIPFCHWTQVRTQEPLVLVDVMGQLPSCYAISSAAIVAGSFSSHNGGHNVLEPCLYGCPVLFGPHMHAQREFARIVLQAGVGKEVSCDTLAESIIEWLESTIHLRAMAFGLIEKNRGSLNRTFQLLQNLYIPRAVQKSGLGKEAV